MNRRLLFFLCLSLPGWLLAQPPLSLGDAIAVGLRNNYQIRIADLNQRVAEENNTWGNAGALPRLDLNVNGRFFRTQNPASFFAGNENISPGLSLNWTLFDGFAMFASKERFELLEEQSAGNAAVVVENSIRGITLAYYDALVAQEQVDVLQEVLDNSKERLEYEQFRLELGSTSTFDLLQFENAVITDSTNLLTQQLTLRNNMRNLLLLMQEPLNKEYRLTDTLNTDFEPYSLVDLERRMLASNNNLQNQYLVQQIRRQETRQVQALYYPTLSVGANASASQGTTLFAARDSTNPEAPPTRVPVDWATDYSFSFTLSFNLFDGFNRQRQVQLAEINEAIASMETRELEQSLQNELFVTYDNYEARRRIYNLQAQNVQNARLNLDLANERFQSGLINTFDFRQIQLQYLNAQIARLQALRDLNSSETELIRLIGGLVREQ